MSEVWKPVVGFEGRYEVSDQGRVRSLDRVLTSAVPVRGYPRRVRGQMLKPVLRKDGYVQFGCRRVLILGHVCVAEAFIGPRPEGLVVCHGNDIRTDNRLSNLSWGTPKENSEGMVARGRSCRGEKSGQAILTTEDVLRIRSYAGRFTYDDIASLFGVGSRCIGKIIRRERWTHV